MFHVLTAYSLVRETGDKYTITLGNCRVCMGVLWMGI